MFCPSTFIIASNRLRSGSSCSWVAMRFPKLQNLLQSMRKRDRPLVTPLAGLIALGLASALLYAFGITARYPLAEGLRHLRAGWATLMHYSLRAGLWHGAVYLLVVAG